MACLGVFLCLLQLVCLCAIRVRVPIATIDVLCSRKDFQQCVGGTGSSRTSWTTMFEGMQPKNELQPNQDLHGLPADWGRCRWIGPETDGTCIPDCGHMMNQNDHYCEGPFCSWVVASAEEDGHCASYKPSNKTDDGVKFPYRFLSDMWAPAGVTLDKIPCGAVAATTSDWIRKTYPGKSFTSFYPSTELQRLAFNGQQLSHYGCNLCRVYDTHSGLMDGFDHHKFRDFNTMEISCRKESECVSGSFYVPNLSLTHQGGDYCHPCPEECFSCHKKMTTFRFKCILKSGASTPAGYNCIEPRPRTSNSTELKTYCDRKTFYVRAVITAKYEDIEKAAIKRMMGK